MSSFATLSDIVSISGQAYTTEQQSRIETLLPLVSDALRSEARKVGKDLDDMIADDSTYGSVVKLVTADIVVRALSLNNNTEPLSQESQSALGYSWSGTYAVPGGGVANSIMRNDLKRLGLKTQRYGTIEFYGGDDSE